MKNNTLIFIVSLLLMLKAEGASAVPSLTSEAVFEVQFEHGQHSDDPDNERENLFTHTEVAPILRFNDNVYIDGVMVLEPVRDSMPGKDTYFRHEGVYVEELKLHYDNGPYAFFAGKFNPGFGRAWDYGRGIWSEDFAEDYEITEKIGFGAAYTRETDFGTHTLTASTFFNDTSFLSQSVFTERGRVDEDDGGAGNTEDFSSLVVSLEGEKLGGIEDLTYGIALRHLAQGDADPVGDDEQGVAVTLGYVFPVSENVTMDALLEAAAIDNFEGALEDRRYVSGSVVTHFYEHWNVTVGATSRRISPEGAPSDHDHLIQLSGGYDFGNGLTLEAGWRGTNEAGTHTDILGALARYALGF